MELDNIFVRENKTKPSSLRNKRYKVTQAETIKPYFSKIRNVELSLKPAPNQEIRVPKYVLSVTLYQVEKIIINSKT